eukprot:4006006-Amphidinium_carterae.1
MLHRSVQDQVQRGPSTAVVVLAMGNNRDGQLGIGIVEDEDLATLFTESFHVDLRHSLETSCRRVWSTRFLRHWCRKSTPCRSGNVGWWGWQSAESSRYGKIVQKPQASCTM